MSANRSIITFLILVIVAVIIFLLSGCQSVPGMIEFKVRLGKPDPPPQPGHDQTVNINTERIK